SRAAPAAIRARPTSSGSSGGSLRRWSRRPPAERTRHTIHTTTGIRSREIREMDIGSAGERRVPVGASRRRTGLGAALGGGGALAAACGAGSRSDGISPGGPPKEKVQLSYPMWLSPQERATVEEACEALTAKFLTIEVKTESSGERDMIAKLITTVASGTPPDLAASNDKMFTEIAMANAYADITPYL